jgi:hypothetical protein
MFVGPTTKCFYIEVLANPSGIVADPIGARSAPM